MNVGVFCVKEKLPRAFTKEERNDLKALVNWAQLLLNIKNIAQAFDERNEVIKQLSMGNVFMERELKMMDLKNKVAALEAELASKK
jgi:hypothetical protein